MKQIKGVWLPESDTHHLPFLMRGPVVDGRGTYQHRKYAEALKHFKGRRVALDIGGHVGFWSMLMVRDFATVETFEPLPQHIECFQRNLEGRDNVRLHMCALGDTASLVPMVWDADATGSSHIATRGEAATNEVPVKTLDSFGFATVDFIKIDVEGFENAVLRGAEATIRRTRPAIVIEQKKGYVGRYGQAQYQGRDLLKSWGMREIWNIGDDILMVYP